MYIYILFIIVKPMFIGSRKRKQALPKLVMQSLHTLIMVVMVITNSGSFWVSLVSLRNLGSHHVCGPEEMR